MEEDANLYTVCEDDAEILAALKSPVVAVNPGRFCHSDEMLVLQNGWMVCVFFDGGVPDQDYVEFVIAPDGRFWGYCLSTEELAKYADIRPMGHAIFNFYRDDLVAAGEGHGYFELGHIAGNARAIADHSVWNKLPGRAPYRG